MTLYPASALRTVALHTQGLLTANGAEPDPTPDRIFQTIDNLGCIQIDTLQVVHRSQNLVLWSRLGSYEPGDLDSLQAGTSRRLFEGWQHAACIIPLTEYRFQMPRQRSFREDPTNWYSRWLRERGLPNEIEKVRERIQREGALKTKDFERGDHPGGAWWNWRPAKVALETLYAFGELNIAGRVNFQRIYDLTERLLPEWVDLSEPSSEERDRFWVERGAKALGVCMPRHAGDYTWMKVTKSRPIINGLIKDGRLWR